MKEETFIISGKGKKELEFLIKKNTKIRQANFADYDKPLSEFKLKSDLSDEFDQHCNIKIPRQVTSHRKLVGPMLIRIRQILDDEIRRSLDPVVDRQIEINKDLVKRVEQLEKIVEEKGIRLKQLEKLEEENTLQINANIKQIFKLKEEILRK